MLDQLTDPNITTRIDGVGLREGVAVADSLSERMDYTALPDGRVISTVPVTVPPSLMVRVRHAAVLRSRALHCAWESFQLYPDPEAAK